MPNNPQTKAPNDMDIHVGSRIRLRRAIMGVSQVTLAKGLGVSFQQVQKYEQGHNRVGSSRLQAIADNLCVPVAWFFEEGPGAPSRAQGSKVGPEGETARFLGSAEGLALNCAFVRIPDPKLRTKIVYLVEALANEAVE
ncbi:helix-turn-helix transcriptional regulator [Ensifer sp.]|jgi:transcriptional regulator with XRE-family HTH domain|uniref:helix-turn-helix domain-containing protein n=1 Tax=Ensifer sp. TaxID=1872086 RepID=UPI002E138C6C|nr:helix-turn-helix transcriptional regulator [Ensifer sp.]